MRESITEPTTTFTPCASLAALGCHLQQIKLFNPVREQVTIGQKTITHTPTDKLYDAFITILAGAHGIVATRGCEVRRPCRQPLDVARALISRPFRIP